MHQEIEHSFSVDISLVSAVYNEAEGIDLLLGKINEVFSKIDLTYEIIIVDDGSSDASLPTLIKAIEVIPNLNVVELYKNVGQVKALSAGMTVAKGKWIVMMDGDLQHNPDDIFRFIEKTKEGYDLVATYREHRKETFQRKIISWFGNRVNRYLTGLKIKDFGSAFRMFNALILKNLKDNNGYVHYNTPMLYDGARKIAQIPITQHKRPFGKTKWNLGMFISYNLDFITVSDKFVRILLYLGFFGFISGILLYLCKFFEVFNKVNSVSAPVSIALTSFLLIIMAIVWREVIVNQRIAKGTPPFIINKIHKK